MIVYKGCITKAYVEAPHTAIPSAYLLKDYYFPGPVKVNLDFSGDAELNFHVNKRQEKKLNDLLQKAMKGLTRIIIKIEEEKNAES